jgi:DNA-binding GntR family transcriptional regulator
VESSAKIDDRPLRETVRDAIRNRIFEGHYAPGARLVERDLADEFNVSRLPIREALRMLRQEGLVSERANSRGIVVSSLTPEQVADLFDVRLALEVLASQLAAVRATASELNDLSSLLDRAQNSLEVGSIFEAHAANNQFHDAITTMARNEFLRAALEPLQGRMHWLFRHATDLPELIREHRSLYEAIASGDPERAGRVSRDHIQKYRKDYYLTH